MEKMDMSKLLKPKGLVSILSLLFGVIFYITWSALYNSWTDISSYSVAVPFTLLGILGILLVLTE
ncbi:MAG: hypothetical protein J7K38_02320 [Thermoplasmata archaeon]|nr:hypothetical protein [Thermoplasmata archaeon]